MATELWSPGHLRRRHPQGVGRIDQETFIDTYAKVAPRQALHRETPITAADLLNDRELPFDAGHGIPLLRVLTDRGAEYCGVPDRHLCMSATWLDRFIDDDNQRRPHQGRWC